MPTSKRPTFARRAKLTDPVGVLSIMAILSNNLRRLLGLLKRKSPHRVASAPDGCMLGAFLGVRKEIPIGGKRCTTAI